MKNWIYLILLLCSGGISFAQTTVVSATVVDSDSTAWAGGTWTIKFMPNGDNPDWNIYNQNGTPLSAAVAFQNGTLNGSGAFSTTIYTSTTISPAGSSWLLTVCPNATSSCGNYTFTTISSSPLNLSSVLTSIIQAPRFIAVAGTRGYTNVEAQVQLVAGATYFNVSLTQQCTYSGSAWACVSSGGSGTVNAGQAAVGRYPNASAAIINHCINDCGYSNWKYVYSSGYYFKC